MSKFTWQNMSTKKQALNFCLANLNFWDKIFNCWFGGCDFVKRVHSVSCSPVLRHVKLKKTKQDQLKTASKCR